MPHPLVLISYSDTNVGHHGYIYQATNWIYTGESAGRNTFVDKEGNEIHEKTVFDRYGSNKTEELVKYGLSRRKKLPKHRYFYFLGSKKEKKEMKEELLKRYEIKIYPKGNNLEYDSSYQIKGLEIKRQRKTKIKSIQEPIIQSQPTYTESDFLQENGNKENKPKIEPYYFED